MLLKHFLKPVKKCAQVLWRQNTASKIRASIINITHVNYRHSLTNELHNKEEI